MPVRRNDRESKLSNLAEIDLKSCKPTMSDIEAAELAISLAIHTVVGRGPVRPPQRMIAFEDL